MVILPAKSRNPVGRSKSRDGKVAEGWYQNLGAYGFTGIMHTVLQMLDRRKLAQQPRTSLCQ